MEGFSIKRRIALPINGQPGEGQQRLVTKES